MERSSLEEEALKRKRRLGQLKRRAEGGGEEAAEGAEGTEASAVPKFRSYAPLAAETAEAGETLGPAPVAAMEDAVADQLKATKEMVRVEEIDISLLAPRKLDWDLKRDVRGTLERLERRTQRAIGELIRQRLADGEPQQDLLAEVNLRSAAAVGPAEEERTLSDTDE